MCSSFVLWVIRQLVSSFPAFNSFMISSQQEASTPPVLKTRFFPYMSGRGSICGSSYKATTQTTALGLAIFHAIRKVSLPPATSNTASAPRPRVSFFTSCSTSCFNGLIMTSASPCSLASSSRSSDVSMAMTMPGP